MSSVPTDVVRQQLSAAVFGPAFTDDVFLLKRKVTQN